MIKIILGLLAIAATFIAFRYFGLIVIAFVEYYGTPNRTPAEFKTAWKEAERHGEESFLIGLVFVILVVVLGFICWVVGDLIF